jgi:tRNA pseudouridine38-40 synthase
VSLLPIPVDARVSLVVEYDGTGFCGWQLQAGSKVETVQGALEKALGKVADQPVRVACAGRTDTGVHATHQVAHFDAPTERSARSWLLGGNVNLPDSVVIRGVHPVAKDFHARFSATARRYRYLILNTEVTSALLTDRVTWVRQPLDVENMHEAAQALLGEQDFSAFRAASCQSSTPMRHVDFVEVFRYGDLVVVDIQANAFLHHMVRNIVGALVAVGKGRIPISDIATLLAQGDRNLAPDTASAKGLYLVGVNYPQEFALPAYSPGPPLLAGLSGP